MGQPPSSKCPISGTWGRNCVGYQHDRGGALIALSSRVIHRWTVVAALCLPALWAQPQSIVPRVLTLDEALAIANEFSPRLAAANASVQGAQAGIMTARAKPNPTFTFGSPGRQQALQNTAVPGLLTGFTYTQPFELPTLRSTRIRAAELNRASNQY